MITSTGLKEKQKKPTFSPFALSIDTEIFWETMTSREHFSSNVVINASSSNVLSELCHDLAIVGLIGSKQIQRTYFKNDKRKLNVALEKGILKRHEIARDKGLIPVISLGPNGLMIAEGELSRANYWKEYKKADVLKRLAFYQFYSSMKSHHEEISMMKADSASPFMAVLNIKDKEFHVLVVKGNESVINHFFQNRQDLLPQRILIVVEELSHLKPIEKYLKALNDRVRLITEHDLKNKFEEMFYCLHENEWQKEHLIFKS